MHTIIAHLAMASAVAARRSGHPQPLGAARTAAGSLGVMALVVIVAIAAFLRAVGKAVRRLVGLLAALMQVATALTSYMFTAALAVFVGLLLIVHR